jgi:hypothetical protein
MPWIVDEPGVFAVVACRLLLAAVFALAAGTKLADRVHHRESRFLIHENPDMRSMAFFIDKNGDLFP